MRLPFRKKVVAHSEVSQTCVVEETSTRRSDGTFPAGKAQSEGATGGWIRGARFRPVVGFSALGLGIASCHSEVSQTCVVEETSTRRSDCTFPAGKVPSEGGGHQAIDPLYRIWSPGPPKRHPFCGKSDFGRGNRTFLRILVKCM